MHERPATRDRSSRKGAEDAEVNDVGMERVGRDVVVVGGGPAGSTVAALVAERGYRTLLIERERFPRFHIGESLMPETYWVFKRLGVLERMKQSPFVRKYSVQFFNASGKESAPFYFDEMNPHECSQTWQVLRSEFDQMLLENAAARGAEVWQETLVKDVLLEPGGGRYPRATGVIAERPGGRRVQVDARVVVDATGTQALLSGRLGIRQRDPQLKKAAVFAHYKGAYRDPDPRDEGATLVLQVQDQAGWFWYIPLHQDIVSIGVVADLDYLIKDRGLPQQTLAEEIDRCPVVKRRLESAERISRVHVLADFSYNSQACAGDGWVLVGDAFTFLDPMYSSGVLFALKSGELAADAIHDALQHGDASGARLSAWGERFYDGVQSIRKLVYAFYTPDFSFGRFTRENPDCKRNLVELLIGDVFRPEVKRIFGRLSRYFHVPDDIRLDA
jgi:flavin-dependent dehydrogenase